MSWSRVGFVQLILLELWIFFFFLIRLIFVVVGSVNSCSDVEGLRAMDAFRIGE